MPGMWGRLCGAVAAAGLLLLVSVPRPALAGERFSCKGVITFADAMTRAVRLSLDLDTRTIHLPSCRKYTELHHLCYGDVLHAADHHFQFGGVGSFENTRLTAELVRDDTAVDLGYAARSLKVYFVGRCEPARRRWSGTIGSAT
jgi:hypothetical protein